MGAKWSQQHFIAIDLALAKGVELEFKGEKYKFSPLTFDDLATIVATARGRALQVWRQQELSRGLRAEEWRLHTMELNAILFGSMPQQTIDYMSDPFVRRLVVMLSLKHEMPDATDETLGTLADKLLDTTEEETVQLVEIIAALTVGPSEPKKGDDGPANPSQPNTGSQSPV